MQHVVADVGLRRERFDHGLPRCLIRNVALRLRPSALTMRSAAVDATTASKSWEIHLSRGGSFRSSDSARSKPAGFGLEAAASLAITSGASPDLPLYQKLKEPR